LLLRLSLLLLVFMLRRALLLFVAPCHRFVPRAAAAAMVLSKFSYHSKWLAADC
jgi:hypothetical protein